MFYSAQFTDHQIPAITAALACCRIWFEYNPLPNHLNQVIIRAEDAAIRLLLPFQPQSASISDLPGRLPLHLPS